MCRARRVILCRRQGAESKLVRVENLDGAGSVVKEGCLAVVGDGMAGLACREFEFFQRGGPSDVVEVVAVLLRPRAHVKNLEAARSGDQHMPAVAGGVDPVESCKGQLGRDLAGGRVENAHAAVVG